MAIIKVEGALVVLNRMLLKRAAAIARAQQDSQIAPSSLINAVLTYDAEV